MENLQHIFNIIDTNNDGRLSDTELFNFLINIDDAITIDDIRRLITEADTNNNGYIEFDEFVNSIGVNITEQDLINAYNGIAPNGLIDPNLVSNYYNLLEIQNLYRQSNEQYINILIRMMGNSQSEFLEFWNFIHSNN
jgi:Ca2+-binding EF-hand superfamily protein